MYPSVKVKLKANIQSKAGFSKNKVKKKFLKQFAQYNEKKAERINKITELKPGNDYFAEVVKLVCYHKTGYL